MTDQNDMREAVDHAITKFSETVGYQQPTVESIASHFFRRGAEWQSQQAQGDGDGFETERLAIGFCKSRNYEEGGGYWKIASDAFCTGYRMSRPPAPAVPDKALEALKLAKEWLEGWGSAEHELSIINDALDSLAVAPAPAAVPDDYTLVPNSALRWLFGEEGDFVPPEVHDGCKPSYVYRKRGKYWWRSVFRELLATAPKPAVLEAESEICDNCGTALPGGCGGVFKDDGEACRYRGAAAPKPEGSA